MGETRWAQFGAWLKRERKRVGRSQKEVAAATGLHPVQVSRIETGESGTTTETLDLLIRALDLDKTRAYEEAGFWPKGSQAESAAEESLRRPLQTIMETLDALPRTERAKLIKILTISYIEEPANTGGSLADLLPPVAPGKMDDLIFPVITDAKK